MFAVSQHLPEIRGVCRRKPADLELL